MSSVVQRFAAPEGNIKTFCVQWIDMVKVTELYGIKTFISGKFIFSLIKRFRKIAKSNY